MAFPRAWVRPAIAAGVTGGFVIGLEIAKFVVRKDLEAIRTKYPTVAVAETAAGIAFGAIPVVGGLLDAILKPLVIEPAAKAIMSPEDQRRYDLDNDVLRWAPIAQVVILIVGIPVTLWFVWADVVRGPQRIAVAAPAVERGAGTALSVVPLPAAQAVAPQLVAASTLPTTGNPETFERGTKARAVRDVLAERIEEGGGAKEPFAVATQIVKEKGAVEAAKGLPTAEVKAELREQAAEAKA